MIRDFLENEISLGSFPSAVWAIGTEDGIEDEGALGHAVAVPMRIPATLDTIYDVASLTKPLITTTLILQAIDEGRIALDDAIQVPRSSSGSSGGRSEELRGTEELPFTYRQLLTHTSGLMAWMPMYAYPDYLDAILAHGRECAPGTKTIYSDLNFVLLYFAIEHLFGDYVAAAQTRIFDRLGIRDALFRPLAALKPRIAATEWGQRYEMKMCADRGIAFDGFRTSLIWGETHDGNSHHLGGTAGNAGLFATARAVFRITLAFVRGELVSRALVAEATRTHPGGRGLGWDKPTPGSDATSMLSPDAFGHTGFTGTSVWVDRGRILVLLTNRVHPCAAPIAMQKIRGEFHRLAGETRWRGKIETA